MFSKKICCVFAFFAVSLFAFSCTGEKKAEKVRGIDFAGEIAPLEKEEDGEVVFSFTEKQKAFLTAFNQQHKTLSLLIALKQGENPSDVDFFFLSGGEKRACATVLASLFSGKIVTVSLCASFLPDGFGVRSASPVSISRLEAAESKIGWYEGEDTIFLGFGASGGISETSRNFTTLASGREYFGSNAGTSLTIFYKKGSGEGKINVKSSNDVLEIRRTRTQKATVLSSLCVHDIFSPLSIDDTSCVSGVLLRFDPAMSDSLRAIKTDPGLIPDWDKNRWRNGDFEVFDWEEFPGVLIFDMKDYAVQDAFLKRLSFFAEKTGFRGSLASDERIKNLHGFNAHDYRPETLAAFFNKAERENFPLNGSERLLKKILITNGQLIEENGEVKAGQGALVSISRESPEYLRWQFLNHECFHGVFFTHEEFREKMSEIYSNMDRTSLEFIKNYYRVSPELDYDTSDLYLMHNELMAYTVQRRVSGVAQYYTGLASRAHVQKSIPDLANYVLSTNASGFVEIAKEIDAFLSENYALNAGRVYQIVRK